MTARSRFLKGLSCNRSGAHECAEVDGRVRISKANIVMILRAVGPV